MVANPSKLQVIFLGLKKNQNLNLEINGDVIANSKEVKLLGVTIDSQLILKAMLKLYMSRPIIKQVHWQGLLNF